MNILGLSYRTGISSAALLVDGEFVSAICEERLNRRKREAGFPAMAVSSILDNAGLEMSDIDHFAMAWNPGIYYESFNALLSQHQRWKGEFLYAVPDQLIALRQEGKRKADHIQQVFEMPDGPMHVHYVTHHRTHAANGFFLSPFEEAAIYTSDSQGEVEAMSFARGNGHQIEVLETVNYPHSLGGLYATFTEYLGFRPNSDEWKVMAMGAMADESVDKYIAMMREVVPWEGEGLFRLKLRYFSSFLPDLPGLGTDDLEELFGPKRNFGDPFEMKHYAIAAALQYVCEKVVFAMLTNFHKRSPSRNLCLSGGFFMNSLLNGKIIENTPFERLFISPCPDDSGTALGAASYLYHQILGVEKRVPFVHGYLGFEYSEAEIQQELERCNLPYERCSDPEASAASMIAEGQIIGWFQGRCEFGQRALGNRSIVADPRDEDIKTRLNKAVKFREKFRPFAPAVIEENASEFFDFPEGDRVPFMEKVYPVSKSKHSVIPAAVHFDGTGRLQTVGKKENPSFYKLIKEFEKITGVPVVINTSFNINGEPMVCSPRDAVNTFFSCGLDTIFLGSNVLKKA